MNIKEYQENLRNVKCSQEFKDMMRKKLSSPLTEKDFDMLDKFGAAEDFSTPFDFPKTSELSYTNRHILSSRKLLAIAVAATLLIGGTVAGVGAAMHYKSHHNKSFEISLDDQNDTSKDADEKGQSQFIVPDDEYEPTQKKNTQMKKQLPTEPEIPYDKQDDTVQDENSDSPNEFEKQNTDHPKFGKEDTANQAGKPKTTDTSYKANSQPSTQKTEPVQVTKTNTDKNDNTPGIPDEPTDVVPAGMEIWYTDMNSYDGIVNQEQSRGFVSAQRTQYTAMQQETYQEMTNCILTIMQAEYQQIPDYEDTPPNGYVGRISSQGYNPKKRYVLTYAEPLVLPCGGINPTNTSIHQECTVDAMEVMRDYSSIVVSLHYADSASPILVDGVFQEDMALGLFVDTDEYVASIYRTFQLDDTIPDKGCQFEILQKSGSSFEYRLSNTNTYSLNYTVSIRVADTAILSDAESHIVFDGQIPYKQAVTNTVDVSAFCDLNICRRPAIQADITFTPPNEISEHTVTVITYLDDLPME